MEDLSKIQPIDKAITELVYEKTKLIKAYRYYNGRRDPEQFRHLEENFGIGTPTSVEFIPLVRKHIDVLVGEYLSLATNPKISCKDKKTLSNIFRDKQLTIYEEVFSTLKKHLNNTIFTSIMGGQAKSDSEIEKEIEELKNGLNRNFISEYEIAGQNIIEYLMQSRNIDFENKRKILFLDLLITGTCYYDTRLSESKSNINFRTLNPLNTFIERNPNSPYLKDSSRAVIREYLSKDQILARYGQYLSKDDLDILDKSEPFANESTNFTYMRTYDNTVNAGVEDDGVLGGFEVTPLVPFERSTTGYFKLYPVYEVQILKTEKENSEFVMNRYVGTRIGEKMYIPLEKDETVIRSSDNPNMCSLSVNGIFYSDRNNDPYSLILATANLQDKFDVLHFYRDNIIAESGTQGDWVDVAFIPKMFGNDLTERLMKWKAYKKTGLAILDSSQEGNLMNTTFGGFDDTVKYNAIQAIDLAIQRTEETCSTITGVFREKLGMVEQRDAVTNVQLGVKQSTYITKQFYQLMDLMTKEILLDSLNLSKIAYKKGISGTLILGNRLTKVFTALPEHYTMTDFDLHIADSAEILREQQELKQLIMEIVKSGQTDLEVLIESFTAKTLTEMKESILNALSKKKLENNQLSQLSQQLEQLSQQSKQLEQENQKLLQELERSKAESDDFKREELELKRLTIKENSDFNKRKLDLDRKRVELEGAQLFDDNLQNDEIKNS